MVFRDSFGILFLLHGPNLQRRSDSSFFVVTLEVNSSAPSPIAKSGHLEGRLPMRAHLHPHACIVASVTKDGKHCSGQPTRTNRRGISLVQRVRVV